MGKGEAVREVKVVWASDKASLQDFLRDVDTVEARMSNLGLGPSGGGRVGGGRSPTATPMSQPFEGTRSAYGGLGGGLSGLPAGGGFSALGMAPIMNLSVTATNVVVSGRNVVVAGGGGGGGGMFGGGGGGGGAAGGGGFNIAAMLGGMGGGAGSLISGVAAGLSAAFIPFAAAAVPAYALSAWANANSQQRIASAMLPYQLQSMTLGGAYGAAPQEGFNVSRAMTRERARITGEMALSQAAGTFYDPIVGLFGGETLAESRAKLQRQMEMAEQQATADERARTFRRMSEGRGVNVSNTPYSDLNTSLVYRYAQRQTSDSLGGFFAPGTNPLLANLMRLSGGSVSGVNDILMPVVGSMQNMDFMRFPSLVSALMKGDVGTLTQGLRVSANNAAFGGNVNALGPLMNSLGQLGAAGGMNQVDQWVMRANYMRIAQQSLGLQRGQALSGLKGSIFETRYGTGFGQLQLDIGAGGDIRGMDLGGLQGNLTGTINQRAKGVEQAERMYDLAKTSRVDEITLRETELRLEQARQALYSAKAQERSFSVFRREETYGLGMSEAGLAGAGIERAVTYQGIFGTPGSTADAERKRLDIINRQIEVERQRLAAGNLSLTQQNEANARLEQLYSKQETTQEMVSRSLFGGQMRIAGLEVQTAGATGARVGMVMGGVAAAPYGVQEIGAKRGELNRIESEIARVKANPAIDPSGEYYKTLVAQRESKAAEVQGSFAQPFGAPPVSFQMRQTMVDAYSRIVSSTASGFGNVRAGFQAQLGLAGERLTQIDQEYQIKLKAAKTTEEKQLLNQQYLNARSGVILNQAMPAQIGLEQGWQERLISQTYGSSGSFDMIASNFTNREAGMFSGLVDRAFGGTKGMTDNWRKQGGFFYQSLHGAIQSPQGFLDTAMGGSGEMNVSVNVAPIEILIKDASGNVVDRQRVQAQATSQTQAQVKPTRDRTSGGG